MEGVINKSKGRVCVTGGTGFVGSWMVKLLLQDGYSVNTTIRSNPNGSTKDISFLTNLPGASDRLQIFNADLDNPDSFGPAIDGCIGVFHVAHPMRFEDEESESTRKSVGGILGILKACVRSKTVKKVVYTSTVGTAFFCDKGYSSPNVVLDESSWTDITLVRNLKLFGASYIISKTLTEKAALDFGEKHCLDVVTVLSPWINGPFICSSLPGSITSVLAMIIGNTNYINYLETTPYVHIDDIARAHIHLFEHAEAKGRYICSSVGIQTEKLHEFLSTRYPEYQISSTDLFTSQEGKSSAVLSSKKLLETGFVFTYGLEEMYDGAIECCKEKGIL